MELAETYNPNKDFENILQKYKYTKLDVYEALIKSIGNTKALESLGKAIAKYQEAVICNQELKNYEAKVAYASSEEFAYTALSTCYYEINVKPGASQYIIMDETEERTESGLFLPPSGDTTKTYYEGTIIAIADCYIKESGSLNETRVKPMNKVGDKVRYRKGLEHTFTLTVNGKQKVCKIVDFTVVLCTFGTYFSRIGTYEPSMLKEDFMFTIS